MADRQRQMHSVQQLLQRSWGSSMTFKERLHTGNAYTCAFIWQNDLVFHRPLTMMRNAACSMLTRPTPMVSAFFLTLTCSLIPCLLAPYSKISRLSLRPGDLRLLVQVLQDKMTYQALSLLPPHSSQQLVPGRTLFDSLILFAKHRLVWRHHSCASKMTACQDTSLSSSLSGRYV